MSTFDLPAIQQALAELSLDGWLFYGFRGSDPIALKVLGLSGRPAGTRRWFYLVPRSGEPRGLAHAIEPAILDPLPGPKGRYASWRSLTEELRQMLAGIRRAAMQYSPENHLPTISRVDAGTVELVRSLGAEVVSSADLVQRFEARLSPAQVDGHRRAAASLRGLIDEVFARVARSIRAGSPMTEAELQAFALQRLEALGLSTDHGPILAVNEHSADPHFEVPAAGSAPVREGDLLLFDVWAKEKAPGSIYADITWCGFAGQAPPPEMARVFEVVRAAREAAVARCAGAFSAGAPLQGCEVDQAARGTIEAAGFGDFFPHRTGHSIHEETHGNGANLDDHETHDTRRLIPWTLFSIEPGIYLPGRFGLRSEVNVLYAGDRAEVTGPPHQQELIPILARY
ncbi:MAG: aminopeptidase P family protein [Planctomycetes bacterium]|nr:aminopeptidase P family protein [Planctomycetota bacterium]